MLIFFYFISLTKRILIFKRSFCKSLAQSHNWIEKATEKMNKKNHFSWIAAQCFLFGFTSYFYFFFHWSDDFILEPFLRHFFFFHRPKLYNRMWYFFTIFNYEKILSKQRKFLYVFHFPTISFVPKVKIINFYFSSGKKRTKHWKLFPEVSFVFAVQKQKINFALKHYPLGTTP